VLANFKIKSNNLDVNLEALNFTLTTGGTANNTPLENLELVDSANNVSYSVSNPASSTSATLAFENVYIQKGIQYNFQLRGDVQDGAQTGSTYSVSVTFPGTAYFQDSDETAAVAGDFSATTLNGKTMTVAAPAFSYAKVTTSNSTVVKDASGVLLFKGKLTANSVDDLKVTKIPVSGIIGDLGSGFSQDFNRIYLYKVNSDGTETKLDDETSLTGTSINFTGFTLTVPKGTSNGVYVVVRGDVKSSPTGTTTEVGFVSSGSWIVKDTDNNSVTTFTLADTTKGHVTTVATVGTYTLTMDTTLTDLNSAKNVLAGGMRLVGAIKATAAKENAKIEDLVLANAAWASATADDLATLYLYDNKELTGTALGSADLDSNAKATFSDVNIEIPTTGSTYLYIGGMVKAIDYSNSPAPDSTATAATTIRLNIPADATGYDTKVVGMDTGDVMVDTGITTTAYTASSTILGAKVSAVTTSFVDASLTNGLQKTIFSFKVTVPDSVNNDYDGDPLAVKLASVVFATSSNGVQLSNFKVERTSGSAGATAASATTGDGTLTINFATTYAAATNDLKIKPGETAEYKILADVAGAAANESVQLIISNVNTDMTFTHNTGTFGVDGSDITAVYPLLTGDTSIDGGTLTY
jgi:hypothetical protein